MNLAILLLTAIFSTAQCSFKQSAEGQLISCYSMFYQHEVKFIAMLINARFY